MFKKILKKIYKPAQYAEFNEGIAELLFEKNKFFRLVFGWRFFENLLEHFTSVKLGERLVEIPIFWKFFFKYMNTPETKEKIKILDFGCVESKIGLHLAALGYDVVGIDLRDYDYKDILPDFSFIQGDIFEQNFETEKFDVIVAISSVEHVGFEAYEGKKNYDDKDLIDLFFKLLKPGGIMYISVPFGERFEEKEWYRIYSKESLQALFENRFEVKEEKIFKIPQTKIWSNNSKEVWMGLIRKNQNA